MSGFKIVINNILPGINNINQGKYSTVSGGFCNSATGPDSVIAGGNNNTSSGSTSVISGGHRNMVTGITATIGGGQYNTAAGQSATIVGGQGNTVSGRYSVAGGRDNTITAWYGIIPGGYQSEVTQNFGLAAGRRAKCNHGGAFVWADDQDSDFASTAERTFNIRAANGVYISGLPNSEMAGATAGVDNNIQSGLRNLYYDPATNQIVVGLAESA